MTKKLFKLNSEATVSRTIFSQAATTVLVVFFLSSGGLASSITDEIDKKIDNIEFEVSRLASQKQDMLEVLNESGFMELTERVEAKLDLSNQRLAEGNSLMREVTRRIAEKEEIDHRQNLQILEANRMIFENKSYIWGITVVITFVFAVIGTVIKWIVSHRKECQNTDSRVRIYKYWEK